MYLLFALVMVLAIVFVSSAIDVYNLSGMGSGFTFMTILSTITFLGAIYGFFITSRMYVLLDEDTYTYYDGHRNHLKGRYSSIRSIVVLNGSITIDSGKGYNESIPLCFRKSELIIAILKSRRSK